MRGPIVRSILALVLLLAVSVLNNAHQASAQPPPPPPPPLTEWCKSQQTACNTSCKQLSQPNTVDFKCLDEGISDTTSTRSVQCVCKDAAGNILSSSTLGGAGAAVVSVGGSSSSSSSASASGTSRSGR